MSGSAFALILLSAINVIWAFDFRDSTKLYDPMAADGKIYYISKAFFVSYTEASRWCLENGGGYPAEIDTARELGYLGRYLSYTDARRIFIAGKHAKKHGKFISQRTGEFIHVFNWDEGEPDNYGGVEDCIEMNASKKGRMSDTPCNMMLSTRHVLCELEKNKIKS